MRLRIRDHKGLNGKIVVAGHHMKLGQGGIREIEFFTQTRQLIAGGRDESLRDRTTLGGLKRLAEQGWVPEEIAQELSEHYIAHREVEHRIQMVHDAQTHIVPTTQEGMDRLARMMGGGGYGGLGRENPRAAGAGRGVDGRLLRTGGAGAATA